MKPIRRAANEATQHAAEHTPRSAAHDLSHERAESPRAATGRERRMAGG